MVLRILRRTHGSIVGYYNIVYCNRAKLTHDTYFICENVVSLIFAFTLPPEECQKPQLIRPPEPKGARATFCCPFGHEFSNRPRLLCLIHPLAIQDHSYLISPCLVAQFVQHVEENLTRVCLDVSVELFSKGPGKHTHELGQTINGS